MRIGGRSERRGRRYGEPGGSLQRVPGDSDCGYKRFAHELSCFREEHNAAYGADSSAVASSTASGRSALRALHQHAQREQLRSLVWRRLQSLQCKLRACM